MSDIDRQIQAATANAAELDALIEKQRRALQRSEKVLGEAELVVNHDRQVLAHLQEHRTFVQRDYYRLKAEQMAEQQMEDA